MPPPKDVKLGPLTRTIIDNAVWTSSSTFPSNQGWSDEFEKILTFLESQGQFKRFFSRLCARERDGALAEARAGFFFHRNGFQILKWEPEAMPGIPGDIEISWYNTEALFLEVKNPTWEGELLEEEIKSGRTKLPKYLHAESRAIDPFERVMFVVGKSLRKFCNNRVNLAVVVDNLFVSPLEMPTDIVFERIVNELANPDYKNVSGAFLLNPVSYGGDVEYRALFVSGIGKPLPDLVKDAFLKENARSKLPHWFNR